MNRSRYVGATALGTAVIMTGGVWMSASRHADAHCQVPCGIYDDTARITRLSEDAATIAKAVTNIVKLAGSRDAQSANQLARWVATKENHAAHIIEVVAEYFLAQRIKPVQAGKGDYEPYLKKLADHHAVMVAAMKTKQHADDKYVRELEHAIQGIAGYYR